MGVEYCEVPPPPTVARSLAVWVRRIPARKSSIPRGPLGSGWLLLLLAVDASDALEEEVDAIP